MAPILLCTIWRLIEKSANLLHEFHFNMKIAIPLFGERVSPHFRTAPEILIVLCQEGNETSTLKFDISNLSLTEKKTKILSFNVDTIICGGIDSDTRQWFEHRGIEVIENVMGKAMEVFFNHLNELGFKKLKVRRPSFEKKKAKVIHLKRKEGS